ncbi:MAG: hypothetical protein NC299_13460, partial [Lachnospiraceae bacterium]|nr:hypothetical protein [Ruminococcus sp.]MCM1276344.1 hypothetical protein [Lachnospiraceae bacterium]
MYAVSDEYKAAIALPDREFRIDARVYLRDGSVLKADDSSITGDVKIESQMMSGSASSSTIDVGAATSKKLTMTVLSESTDLHVFAGARARLWVSL